MIHWHNYLWHKARRHYLSYYTIHSMKEYSGLRYDRLVVLPLAVITVFCFGFVMMHPYNDKQRINASEVAASNTALSQSTTVVNIPTQIPHLSPLATSSSTLSTSPPADGPQTISQTSSDSSGARTQPAISSETQKSPVSSSTTNPQPAESSDEYTVDNVLKNLVPSITQVVPKILVP